MLWDAFVHQTPHVWTDAGRNQALPKVVEGTNTEQAQHLNDAHGRLIPWRVHLSIQAATLLFVPQMTVSAIHNCSTGGPFK